jgi:hypothetical protein
MKRVFLVMMVSAMLVTLGFAQTPDASSNTDPADVKGCLGGSEGNYTVVEDGSGQLFKITSSSIDLKAHLGHDVKLTGHKVAGAAKSLTASEVSMISEHCAAAAAAAPAAVVDPSPQTSIPPDTAAAAPATASAPTPDAAAPPPPAAPAAATVTAPVVEPAASAATVTPESAAAPAPAAAAAATPPPATTPAVETAAPAAAMSPSAPAVTSHVVEEAAPAPRPSAHAHKLAAKRAAADAAADTASTANVSPSPDTTTPAAQDAATPAAAAAPSAETVTPPDAPAVAPAPVTHRTGSLTLLIAFVVLVVVLGTMAPLIGRWRKRKMLERDGAPNLSFTNEVGMNGVIADEAGTNEANTGRDKQQPRKIA